MELITVRTFQNYFTAHLLLTRLRAAGLECYLKDEFTVTTDPFLSNAIGGIKLVVRKEDEQQVSALLQEWDEAYRNKATCPKCGSHEIELVPKETTTNWITMILSWLFGNYAISAKNVYQCSVCKYESDTFPESFDEEDLLTNIHDLN